MSANLYQFPLTVTQWQAAPSYLTDITRGRNGQEVRNAIWQDPLYRYNAAFSIKTYADIETLVEFFHAVKGREQSFLIKDYSDFAIARQTIATGDGVATTFQLIKTYTTSFGSYQRTITKPKSAEDSTGVLVWVNGSAVAAADRSHSASTGVITITSPSPVPNGHAVEASCAEFYVPVRFDTDTLPVEMLSYWLSSGASASNVQIPDIPLVEVRFPNE